MDLTPSAFDGLKERASRLAKRFSGLRESPDTISLFHRALLRFPNGEFPSLRDRDHFFRLWYRAMRSVIADLYRAEQRHRISPQAIDTTTGAELAEDGDVDPVANEMAKIVDAALADLAEMDPVAARIVHLRHFDERTWQEIAQELGVTYSAVQRKWAAAKAWLRAELKKRSVDSEPGVD